MKHSPGPWKWAWMLVADDGAKVAVYGPPGEAVTPEARAAADEAREYNRTLIAIAPEMREMLLMLEWGDYTDIGQLPVCVLCIAPKAKGHDADCQLATLLDKIR